MGVLPANWYTKPSFVLTGSLENQERLCTAQVTHDRDPRPLVPAWAQHGLHRPLTPDERRHLRAYTSPRSPRVMNVDSTTRPRSARLSPRPDILPDLTSWPEARRLTWRPTPPTSTGFDFKPPPMSRDPFGADAFSSRPQSGRAGLGSKNLVHIVEHCSWDDRGGRGVGNVSPRDIVKPPVPFTVDFSHGSGPPSRYFPTTKR